MFTEIPDLTPSSNTDIPEAAVAADENTNVIRFPKISKADIAFRGPMDENVGKVYAGTSRGVDPNATFTPDELLAEHRRNVISNLCEVYTKEIYFKLVAMGYDVFTEPFDKDMQFVHEALHSALLRTYSTYHPIQEYVDDHFELIPLEEFEQMTLMNPETPDEDPSETT